SRVLGRRRPGRDRLPHQRRAAHGDPPLRPGRRGAPARRTGAARPGPPRRLAADGRVDRAPHGAGAGVQAGPHVMLEDRQRRVVEWLRARGHAGVLLASPGMVRCFSGYTVPIETGPNPFEAGPPILGISREGATFLVVSEWEEPAARDRGA